ncbi:hypothetical protein QTP86_028799 [Hemibagrus guttatus]|nr:hypothetical protein QTP86_028799 [Hemibagrus guttatus]
MTPSHRGRGREKSPNSLEPDSHGSHVNLGDNSLYQFCGNLQDPQIDNPSSSNSISGNSASPSGFNTLLLLLLLLSSLHCSLPLLSPNLPPLFGRYCYSSTDVVEGSEVHLHCLPLIRTILGSRGACAYLRHHWASRQDTPWTECQPIAGHTHTHSLIHSHTHNLEMPINLPCMSLDWGRKPEYPEETPEARGEHANSTHTTEAGIEHPTLEV